MPLQIQFKIQQRDDCIQKILNKLEVQSSTHDVSVEQMLDNFDEFVKNGTSDVQKLYKHLKIHYYIRNLDGAIDNLDEYESGDLMILGDVKECEKEVKESIIGGFTNE